MNIRAHFNPGWYFLFSITISIWLASQLLLSLPAIEIKPMIFKGLLLVSYGVMYQLPAIIIYWLLKRWQGLAISVTVIVSLLCHILLFADARLFDLYGFHINGFVINLLTTRGGFESLGADQTNPWPMLGRLIVLIGLHLIFVKMSLKVAFPHFKKRYLILGFLALTVSERVVYGVSQAQLDGRILQMSDAMPLYQPLKMHSFLKKLGVEVKKQKASGFSKELSGQLDYPKSPLQYNPDIQPLNIIYLVAESLRWDMLTPKIMPETWKFSEKAWRFESHYSTGNGTRQGLFGLFYGLYGSYWDRFLQAEKQPVFFDVLDEKKYDYFLHTSAKFTYPEFDRTIFKSIPADQLQELGDMIPWQRDIKNIDLLINELKKHDSNHPTFSFMFFESTHARYYFPDEEALQKDYLKNLDYSALSRKELLPQIKGMKGRYINAAHHVDKQIGRLLNYLKQSGKLENTIVMITGDHGEEFMEKGRWGHNSAFTEEQVRTPMVIYMPGSEPRIIKKRSSHLDITPTVLTKLGVTNPIRDYSLGKDLSQPVEDDTVIVASWTSIGIINDSGKMVVPFKSTSQHSNLTTTLNDKPVEAGKLIEGMSMIMPKVIADARRFTKRK